MRIFNFILAVMFLLFAFLQINDPDPVVWILIYGSMAVVSVMAAFEFYPLRVILALLVAFAGYSIFYFRGVLEWLGQDDRTRLFSEEMKEQYPYIEESREFLGLLICMAVLGFYLYRSRKGRTG